MIEFKISNPDSIATCADLILLGKLAEHALKELQSSAREPYEAPNPFPETATAEADPARKRPDEAAAKKRIPAPEEVRAKGQAAAKKHGKPAVKAILERFEVKSMSDLTESDRAAFLLALEELEAPADA